MTKQKHVQPTEKELAILAVLWEKGPSTVRQVHEILTQTDRTGYTTTLKLMQIMTEKGLLRRNDAQRTHIYRAKHPQQATQQRLVKNLLEKAFAGSAENLVMQALSAKKISPEELTKIRKLLDTF